VHLDAAGLQLFCLINNGRQDTEAICQVTEQSILIVGVVGGHLAETHDLDIEAFFLEVSDARQATCDRKGVRLPVH
jgi:hypothetical protein